MAFSKFSGSVPSIKVVSMPHSGRGAISEAEYRQEADKILAEISDVVPMEKSYLSDGSLYREFI